MMLEELLCSVNIILKALCTYRSCALVLGLVGGTIWHTIGGARNAPPGQRIAQAISRAKARVPIIGGNVII